MIGRRRTCNQLVNTVHGCLTVYDLPDLARLIGTKLTTEEPLNACGDPLRAGEEGSDILSGEPSMPGLAGVWYGSLNLADPRDQDPLDELDRNLDLGALGRGREWSAQWFGFLVAPVSGRVTFYVDSDPGLDLSIGRLSRSIGIDRGGQDRFSMTMKKGTPYPFRIVYNHSASETGHLKIRWSWEGQSIIPVTREYLRHSPAQQRKMREVW